MVLTEKFYSSLFIFIIYLVTSKIIDDPKGNLVPVLTINHLSNCIILVRRKFTILGTGFTTVEFDVRLENFAIIVNITKTGNNNELK